MRPGAPPRATMARCRLPRSGSRSSSPAEPRGRVRGRRRGARRRGGSRRTSARGAAHPLRHRRSARSTPALAAAFADDPRGRRGAARRRVDRASPRGPHQAGPSRDLSLGARWLRGTREGGLVDPTGLERLIESVIRSRPSRITCRRAGSRRSPYRRRIATGRCRRLRSSTRGRSPPWSLDPASFPRAVRIAPQHAFASAAIRLSAPCASTAAPLRRRNCARTSPRPRAPARARARRRESTLHPAAEQRPGHIEPDAFAGPVFLLGKDAQRAPARSRRHRSRASAASTTSSRPGAVAGEGLRRRDQRGARSSEGPRHATDALAPRSRVRRHRQARDRLRDLRRRSRRVGGAAGRLLRLIMERDSPDESDLLSYLLFDGEFAGRLLEVGGPTRARHAELCAFFDAAL